MCSRRREAGAIPSTLLTVNHSASHDPYLRACKAAGYAAHPARTPRALAGFALDLLTTAGDRGVDCFFGSGVFGEEAERRGVRWLGIEQSRRHVETARLRFADARLPEPASHRRPRASPYARRGTAPRVPCQGASPSRR